MNGPALAMTARFDPGIGADLVRCRMDLVAVEGDGYWLSAYVQAVTGTTATVKAGYLGSTPDYQTLTVPIDSGELAVSVVYDEDTPAATNNRRCTWTMTVNGQTASGYINRSMSGRAAKAAFYGYFMDGVTYDMPTVTRWQSTYLGLSGTPQRHYFALHPPVGGNVVRMQRTGAEFVIRRTGLVDVANEYPVFTVYRRNSPTEDWQATATTVPTGAHSSNAWWPLLLALDPWLFAFAGGLGVSGCYVSVDEGASWTWADDYFPGIPNWDVRQTLNQYKNGIGLIYLAALADPRDSSGAVIAYSFGGNDEQLVVRAVGESSEVFVDPARDVGQDGCRPCPQIWRRSDGTWVVGWLVNDDWTQVSSEYASLDTSLFGSWTQEAGEVVWGAGSGDMSAVVCHIGRDGSQVLAGYHGELQRFIVLARPNDTGIWSGPYLNVNEPLAAMPYVTQWGDGTWEVGWLIDGTWTRYTAGDPTGTWEVVS